MVPQLLRDLFFLGMSMWTYPVWRRKQSLAPQVEGEAGSQVTMATRLSLGASRYLHTKNKKAQSTTDINTPAHLEILTSVLFLRDAGSSGQVRIFFPPLSPASAATIVPGDKHNNGFQLKGDTRVSSWRNTEDDFMVTLKSFHLSHTSQTSVLTSIFITPSPVFSQKSH